MSHEPLTRDELVEFIAFCKAKPAELRYTYSNPSVCPLTQFAKATNRPHLVAYCWSFNARNDLESALNVPLNTPEDWSFGRLAQRLETLFEPADAHQ